MMKRFIAFTLMAVWFCEAVAFAVDAKGAAYYGGTVSTFRDAKDPVEGRLDTRDDATLIFTAGDKPFAGQQLAIPYEQIVDLEYGQKAGRRVGAAVATTVLLGPIGLLALFSKKRKHFLTVTYTDGDAKEQVAVLELGKDLIRTALPIVETRSGKPIQYQDDEARKSAGR